MPRNLDLSALRSFMAVAECGGVTRAAQRLHLTQSAVSMQIKRLEESLDVALLLREGRGVSLTRRGEELLASARKLVSLNDEIFERMGAPATTGAISLGVPHDIVYPHIPDVLRRFNDEMPGVRINLVSAVSEILLEKYDEGSVDVILTTEYGGRADAEMIDRRPLVWVGALGGRAWRRRPTPIAFERRCAFRKRTQDALEAAGLGWEWAVDTDHLDAAFATIAADLAICTLLRGAYPPSMEEIAHEGALPELPELNINMYGAAASNKPLAVELCAELRRRFAEGPYGATTPSNTRWRAA